MCSIFPLVACKLIVELPLKNHINHNTSVNKKSKILLQLFFAHISRLQCVAADDNIRQNFRLALSSWLSSSSLIKPCFNALFAGGLSALKANADTFQQH